MRLPMPLLVMPEHPFPLVLMAMPCVEQKFLVARLEGWQRRYVKPELLAVIGTLAEVSSGITSSNS